MTKPIFIFIVAAVISVGTPALAQKNSTAQDPQDKLRKIREEPKNAFKKWLEDVGPIITSQEVRAWNQLDNDTERERFIEDFWDRRKPDRDSNENEYRETYYERIAYVNEHFSSGIPGVKTDRGRIYLKYGKPDEVESHPVGGAYERTTSEGGGSTSTYPFERWWYRHLPNRSDVDVEFVDPTSTGEYRIARNPFEKDALVHVPGTAPPGIGAGEYALAASGIGNPFSNSAKDSEFEWLDRMKLRDEAPSVNFDRIDRTGQPVLEDNFLSSAVQINYFKQTDDRVIVAFTVQTDNKDLVFRDLGGIQTARLNISGRITSIAGRRIGFFEDAVTTTALPTELIDLKDRKSAYQRALSLMPGRYRIDLLVRDVESGSASFQRLGFEVPKFGNTLASSSLVLASVLNQVSDVPASRQFMIGDKRVIPSMTGTFHRGAPIGLYMQIYNADIDQTTLRPAVDVEYVVLRDGKELAKQVEDWRGVNIGSGSDRLTLARLIDSSAFNPGEYALAVRIHDRVSGRSIIQNAKFTISR